MHAGRSSLISFLGLFLKTDITLHLWRQIALCIVAGGLMTLDIYEETHYQHVGSISGSNPPSLFC